MTVRVKGIELTFGDRKLVVPPIALGALEQLQQRISQFTGDVRDAGQIATVIDAAFASLKRNYPEITREEVGDMVDVGNMAEVFESVMDVSGMRRKAIEAETPASGEPQGN